MKINPRIEYPTFVTIHPVLKRFETPPLFPKPEVGDIKFNPSSVGTFIPFNIDDAVQDALRKIAQRNARRRGTR